MIKEQFNAGELKTGLPESGEYIFVEKCPNTYIVVRAQTARGVREYIMKERDTNNVPKGEEFISLAVVNTGEQMGEVIIRTGFGTFTQSNDHQKVTVDNEINLPSNITFATPQPVYAASNALFKTEVQNWPSEYLVTFKGAQAVTISGSVTTKIDDSTPVKVNIQNDLNPDPVVNGLPDVNFDVANKTIAAKAGRKGLILQAPETNQGDIIVQGFLRVAAGAVVPFPASNAVSLTGVTGDMLYVGEEI